MYCKVLGNDKTMNSSFELQRFRSGVRRWLICGLLTFAAAAALLAADHSPPPPQSLNVLTLKAVPNGHFLVQLETAGHRSRLNLEVKSGQATAVAASEPRLEGLRGEFQLIGNGVFLISFANDHHRATQFWVFHPNGSAAVKEVPDRGEHQTAVPVKDGSLEPKPDPR